MQSLNSTHFPMRDWQIIIMYAMKSNTHSATYYKHVAGHVKLLDYIKLELEKILKSAFLVLFLFCYLWQVKVMHPSDSWKKWKYVPTILDNSQSVAHFLVLFSLTDHSTDHIFHLQHFLHVKQ